MLQADGGTRCAAINAAVLALASAGVPLRDLAGSCAAGVRGSKTGGGQLPRCGGGRKPRSCPCSPRSSVPPARVQFLESAPLLRWLRWGHTTPALPHAHTGFLEGQPLLDLNFVEDSAGGPDCSVALHPNSSKLVLMQMDARWVRAACGVGGGQSGG